MTTRIYIAAPLSKAHAANEMADMILVADGYEIVSRWHRVVRPGASDPTDAATRIALHADNKADIRRADILVVVSPLGGKATYVEAGIAEERRTPVLWYCPGGEGKCIASLHVAETLDEFFPMLRILAERVS